MGLYVNVILESDLRVSENHLLDLSNGFSLLKSTLHTMLFWGFLCTAVGAEGFLISGVKSPPHTLQTQEQRAVLVCISLY